MRTFKFRVWDQTRQEFVDTSRYERKSVCKDTGLMLLDFDGKIRIADFPCGNGDNSANSVFSPVENPDNFIVQQFTGIKDHSNKEIYEGDILLHRLNYEESYGNLLKDEILEVKWHDGSFFIGRYLLSQNGASELSIIGNIFQNKDLL